MCCRRSTSRPWCSRATRAAEESEAMARQIPGALFTRIHSPAPVVSADLEPFIAEMRRFVSRIKEEEADLDRVLETVLFTDIVGSAEQVADRGDRAWKELIERHHAFVRGAIARWRGREMDTAGDGFFAAFDGPARAIRCAQAIVDGVRFDGDRGPGPACTRASATSPTGRSRGSTVVIGSRDRVVGRRVRGAGVANRAGPRRRLRPGLRRPRRARPEGRAGCVAPVRRWGRARLAVASRGRRQAAPVTDSGG